MGLMDEGETVVVSQWIASKKCGNRHHADRKKETWVIELTWYSRSIWPSSIVALNPASS
jgi:hypothetical protein